jgi:hypothetical protein
MAGTTTKHLTLEAAGLELGLRRDEFTLGIQHGVIRTCWSGDELCVRAGEVARWRADPGELAELTRLVHATEAAGLAGISRHRFEQLAGAGAIRPVRSYTNRYHAEVWQYSTADARMAVAPPAANHAPPGTHTATLATPPASPAMTASSSTGDASSTGDSGPPELRPPGRCLPWRGRTAICH